MVQLFLIVHPDCKSAAEATTHSISDDQQLISVCITHCLLPIYCIHIVVAVLCSSLATVHNNTHTHLFNGPLSGTTRVSQYQKGKTNLDFTEARDSEWQWHQLGQMQVCTLLQTDNHASIPPLSFLQAGCPSCRPTNSIKALKTITDASARICFSDFGIPD